MADPFAGGVYVVVVNRVPRILRPLLMIFGFGRLTHSMRTERLLEKQGIQSQGVSRERE
jgi:hypothetical protein